MNKSDLIDEVAKVTGTKRVAKEAVECILAAITKGLKRKKNVTLIGFGTFKVSKRKARRGRNPYTGEPMKIKAKNVTRFVPGKGLKEAVI